MSELILHHYDFSNYSEKVRVALGYKQLAWASVTVPPVLPKADLTALTGGYRRAPVLQVGADIYCDTRLILRELERRHPDPPLFPVATQGMAAAITAWAEGSVFRPIMLYAWGTNHDLMPSALFEDRARMRGLPVPSVQSVERAAMRNAPLVRAQLPLVENLLADGRTWACGEAFSEADTALYHALWFLTDRSDRLAHELSAFKAVRHWLKRVRDLGHGRPHVLTAEEAIEVARALDPVSRPGHRHPEDPEFGSRVEVRAADYARDPIIGSLDGLDDDEIAIRIENDRVGEVVVHFPRVGYELRVVDGEGSASA